MDWVTFSYNTISSLAWPVTFLILVFIFINKGTEISKILKSIKYKDFELILRDDLVSAKKLSDTIQSKGVSVKGVELLSINNKELLKLAELDSSLAILKVWQELELKITQLIQHNGLMRFTTLPKFLNKLLDLGKIDKVDVELFNKLRKIRNEVVHLSPYGSQIKMTMAEILEYKGFVDVFLARLESIRQEDGYIDIE